MKNNLLLITCLGGIIALAPFAIDMYLPALPAMALGLDTRIDNLEASVSIFLLGYALSQVIFGPLSDRFGRRVVLLSGLLLFAVGSLLSALAASVEQLYVFRFIQALGGGASVAVFALIKDMFDEKGSVKMISYIMSLVVVAPLVAPILGGYVLISLGWEWIFYLLAGYATLIMLLTRRVVPKPKQPRRAPPTLPVKFGISQLTAGYRKVLANRLAMSHILTGALAFSGLFAFIAGSPFVYIEYFGVTKEHYGYLFGINAATLISINLLNARALLRFSSSAKTVTGALLLGALSLVLLSLDVTSLGLSGVIIAAAVFVGLLGLISTNAIAATLSYFSEKDTGTASAVYGVLQFGIGAITSAIVSAMPSIDPSPMLNVMAISGLLACLSSILLLIGLKKIPLEQAEITDAMPSEIEP